MASGWWRRFVEALSWRKVGGTRVFPVTAKILVIFVLFLLSSNIATNYINLTYSKEEVSKLLKELLVKDIRELYGFLNLQHEIYNFSNDLEDTVQRIQDKCLHDFKKKSSMSFGIQTNGSVFFQAFADESERERDLENNSAFAELFQSFGTGAVEGFLRLECDGSEYFTVYSYHPRWETFLFRGEEYKAFFEPIDRILIDISIISLIITLACALVGMILLRYILRFISRMTDDIVHMIGKQEFGLVNLEGASNDDVTFLGTAFNSLSSSVNNLMNIFKKFASQDVVARAYREREVRLEGSSRELACLFTDIKRFTFITETLGEEIITLLNLHYGNAIREIVRYDGIVASIIGDALLAVYGAIERPEANKSVQAIQSAWAIQREAAVLRKRMQSIKEKIEATKLLTAAELNVYEATLIEVGVGIDGGNVFYGNIGSTERMTNTVIGDNVNAASRLEGLTREYHVPVVVSEYIKDDVESTDAAADMIFVELDMVRVKGKTISARVYSPFEAAATTRSMKAAFKQYQEGLALYYRGEWRKANAIFRNCAFEAAEVMVERTSGKCPSNWSGVWDMKTK